MTNLVLDNRPRDFFVWINPQDWFVRHNLRFTGQFCSNSTIAQPGMPAIARTSEDNLAFLPNPTFSGFMSFFQVNLIRSYMAEYNLEMGRRGNFRDYPSRLEAIFLLENEEEAYKYRDHNIAHVGDRILRKVRTIGTYRYSIHDSSWIEFCRLPHSMDSETNDFVSRAYWSGRRVVDQSLVSMGEPWSCDPITEVLYLGCVEFYDRNVEIA